MSQSREIKFRAWDTIDRKMYRVEELALNWEQGPRPSVVYSELENNAEVRMLRGDKCAAMQFTGLKDKNGGEIFEGDVVNHAKWGKQSVVWKYGGFGLEVRGIGAFTDGFTSFATVSADYENLELVGNIYENPELLASLD
jgi:uncharacterized phage protein (TIGR01671 family)